MNLLQKTVLCSAVVISGTVAFGAKKKPPVDLKNLPPIPGVPMSESEFSSVIDEVLATFPKEYGTFDNKPLLISEIEPQIRAMANDPRTKQGGKEAIKKLVEKVCSSALEKKAIMKLATTHSSYKPVTDERYQEEYKSLVSRYRGEENLNKSLKKDGVSQEQFKKIVTENIVIRNYVDSFKNTIKVSDKEIEVEFNKNRSQFSTAEQVSASHILKKLPKDATDDIKKSVKDQVQKIIDQLKQGADFGELAKKESDCPSSDKGGSLGFFTKERMVKPFSEAAFSMEKGEVSGIVETRFGYHIIKLDDKKAADSKKLADVKDSIVKTIQGRKMRTEIQATIQQCIQDCGGKLNISSKK